MHVAVRRQRQQVLHSPRGDCPCRSYCTRQSAQRKEHAVTYERAVIEEKCVAPRAAPLEYDSRMQFTNAIRREERLSWGAAWSRGSSCSALPLRETLSLLLVTQRSVIKCIGRRPCLGSGLGRGSARASAKAQRCRLARSSAATAAGNCPCEAVPRGRWRRARRWRRGRWGPP